MPRCQKCNFNIGNNSKFCTNCGSEFIEQPKAKISVLSFYCNQCGAQNFTNSTNCVKCKIPLDNQIKAHMNSLAAEDAKRKFKKGIQIGAMLLGKFLSSNSQVQKEDMNMADFKSRICPFCKRWTYGTGPCGSCAR